MPGNIPLNRIKYSHTKNLQRREHEILTMQHFQGHVETPEEKAEYQAIIETLISRGVYTGRDAWQDVKDVGPAAVLPHTPAATVQSANEPLLARLQKTNPISPGALALIEHNRQTMAKRAGIPTTPPPNQPPPPPPVEPAEPPAPRRGPARLWGAPDILTWWAEFAPKFEELLGGRGEGGELGKGAKFTMDVRAFDEYMRVTLNPVDASNQRGGSITMDLAPGPMTPWGRSILETTAGEGKEGQFAWGPAIYATSENYEDIHKYTPIENIANAVNWVWQRRGRYQAGWQGAWASLRAQGQTEGNVPGGVLSWYGVHTEPTRRDIASRVRVAFGEGVRNQENLLDMFSRLSAKGEDFFRNLRGFFPYKEEEFGITYRSAKMGEPYETSPYNYEFLAPGYDPSKTVKQINILQQGGLREELQQGLYTNKPGVGLVPAAPGFIETGKEAGYRFLNVGIEGREGLLAANVRRNVAVTPGGPFPGSELTNITGEDPLQAQGIYGSFRNRNLFRPLFVQNPQQLAASEFHWGVMGAPIYEGEGDARRIIGYEKTRELQGYTLGAGESAMLGYYRLRGDKGELGAAIPYEYTASKETVFRGNPTLIGPVGWDLGTNEPRGGTLSEREAWLIEHNRMSYTEMMPGSEYYDEKLATGIQRAFGGTFQPTGKEDFTISFPIATEVGFSNKSWFMKAGRQAVAQVAQRLGFKAPTEVEVAPGMRAQVQGQTSSVKNLAGQWFFGGFGGLAGRQQAELLGELYPEAPGLQSYASRIATRQRRVLSLLKGGRYTQEQAEAAYPVVRQGEMTDIYNKAAGTQLGGWEFSQSLFERFGERARKYPSVMYGKYGTAFQVKPQLIPLGLIEEREREAYVERRNRALTEQVAAGDLTKEQAARIAKEQYRFTPIKGMQGEEYWQMRTPFAFTTLATPIVGEDLANQVRLGPEEIGAFEAMFPEEAKRLGISLDVGMEEQAAGKLPSDVQSWRTLGKLYRYQFAQPADQVARRPSSATVVTKEQAIALSRNLEANMSLPEMQRVLRETVPDAGNLLVHGESNQMMVAPGVIEGAAAIEMGPEGEEIYIDQSSKNFYQVLQEWAAGGNYDTGAMGRWGNQLRDIAEVSHSKTLARVMSSIYPEGGAGGRAGSTTGAGLATAVIQRPMLEKLLAGRIRQQGRDPYATFKEGKRQITLLEKSIQNMEKAGGAPFFVMGEPEYGMKGAVLGLNLVTPEMLAKKGIEYPKVSSASRGQIKPGSTIDYGMLGALPMDIEQIMRDLDLDFFWSIVGGYMPENIKKGLQFGRSPQLEKEIASTYQAWEQNRTALYSQLVGTTKAGTPGGEMSGYVKEMEAANAAMVNPEAFEKWLNRPSVSPMNVNEIAEHGVGWNIGKMGMGTAYNTRRRMMAAMSALGTYGPEDIVQAHTYAGRSYAGWLEMGTTGKPRAWERFLQSFTPAWTEVPEDKTASHLAFQYITTSEGKFEPGLHKGAFGPELANTMAGIVMRDVRSGTMNPQLALELFTTGGEEARRRVADYLTSGDFSTKSLEAKLQEMITAPDFDLSKTVAGITAASSITFKTEGIGRVPYKLPKTSPKAGELAKDVFEGEKLGWGPGGRETIAFGELHKQQPVRLTNLMQKALIWKNLTADEIAEVEEAARRGQVQGPVVEWIRKFGGGAEAMVADVAAKAIAGPPPEPIQPRGGPDYSRTSTTRVTDVKAGEADLPSLMARSGWPAEVLGKMTAYDMGIAYGTGLAYEDSSSLLKSMGINWVPPKSSGGGATDVPVSKTRVSPGAERIIAGAQAATPPTQVVPGGPGAPGGTVPPGGNIPGGVMPVPTGGGQQGGGGNVTIDVAHHHYGGGTTSDLLAAGKYGQAVAAAGNLFRQSALVEKMPGILIEKGIQAAGSEGFLGYTLQGGQLTGLEGPTTMEAAIGALSGRMPEVIEEFSARFPQKFKGFIADKQAWLKTLNKDISAVSIGKGLQETGRGAIEDILERNKTYEPMITAVNAANEQNPGMQAVRAMMAQAQNLGFMKEKAGRQGELLPEDIEGIARANRKLIEATEKLTATYSNTTITQEDYDKAVKEATSARLGFSSARLKPIMRNLTELTEAYERGEVPTWTEQDYFNAQEARGQVGTQILTQEKQRATMELPEEKGVAGGMGRFLRRALGGFGLMYLRSLGSFITGPMGEGQQQRIALDEMLTQQGAVTGAAITPQNQMQRIANYQALGGLAYNPMLQIQQLQATAPAFRDISTLASAGLGTYAGLMWYGSFSPPGSALSNLVMNGGLALGEMGIGTAPGQAYGRTGGMIGPATLGGQMAGALGGLRITPAGLAAGVAGLALAGSTISQLQDTEGTAYQQSKALGAGVPFWQKVTAKISSGTVAGFMESVFGKNEIWNTAAEYAELRQGIQAGLPITSTMQGLTQSQQTERLNRMTRIYMEQMPNYAPQTIQQMANLIYTQGGNLPVTEAIRNRLASQIQAGVNPQLLGQAFGALGYSQYQLQTPGANGAPSPIFQMQAFGPQISAQQQTALASATQFFQAIGPMAASQIPGIGATATGGNVTNEQLREFLRVAPQYANIVGTPVEGLNIQAYQNWSTMLPYGGTTRPPAIIQPGLSPIQVEEARLQQIRETTLAQAPSALAGSLASMNMFGPFKQGIGPREIATNMLAGLSPDQAQQVLVRSAQMEQVRANALASGIQWSQANVEMLRPTTTNQGQWNTWVSGQGLGANIATTGQAYGLAGAAAIGGNIANWIGTNGTNLNFANQLQQFNPMAITKLALAGAQGLDQWALADLSLQGGLTGLPWGTTSLRQGNISAADNATRIFGAGWQGTRGGQAAVTGWNYQAGRLAQTGDRPQDTVGGMWGLQWAQQQAGYEYQMGQAGIQAQQIALQERYMPQFWAIEDKQRNLNWRQQEWGFQYQQKSMALQSQQFYQNMGMQQQQAQMQRGWTQEDWAFQAQQRAQQWGWTQEDFQENVRFMSGRQRKLAERQMERQTIQFGQEGDQIEKQQKRQKQLWALEDERFALQKKQYEENKDLQEENLKRQKEFFEEGKKLQVEQTTLQRKYQQEQLELQKQSVGLQAAYAQKTKEIQEQIMKLNQAQEKQGGLYQVAVNQNTTMWNAIIGGLNYVIQKAPGALESIIQGLQGGDVSTIPNYQKKDDPHPHKQALGGDLWPGRRVIVGEDSPEILRAGVIGSVVSLKDVQLANQARDRWQNGSIFRGSQSSTGGGPQVVNVYIGNERLASFIVSAVKRDLEVA